MFECGIETYAIEDPGRRVIDKSVMLTGRIPLLGESIGRAIVFSLLLFYPFERTDGKRSPTETFVVGSARQNAAFRILERSKALPTLHTFDRCSPLFQGGLGGIQYF